MQLANVPRAGTAARAAYDIMAANPDQSFGRRDIFKLIYPESDSETPEGLRDLKNVGQALVQMHNNPRYAIIRTEEFGMYRFDPTYEGEVPAVAFDGGGKVKVNADKARAWITIPMKDGELTGEDVAKIIKADVLGQSREGNWICRDPEDKFWEIRVTLEGRLL